MLYLLMRYIFSTHLFHPKRWDIPQLSIRKYPVNSLFTVRPAA